MIGPCWSSFGHLVKIVGVSWNGLKRSIMKAERDLYFSASDQRVIRGDMSLEKNLWRCLSHDACPLLWGTRVIWMRSAFGVRWSEYFLQGDITPPHNDSLHRTERSVSMSIEIEKARGERIGIWTCYAFRCISPELDVC